MKGSCFKQHDGEGQGLEQQMVSMALKIMQLTAKVHDAVDCAVFLHVSRLLLSP